MGELVLFAYEGEEAADRVLDDLLGRALHLDVDLDSCGIVRVAADGRLTVTTTDWPGSGSPFWGMLWEALFGLVFLVPSPGSAYGPNLGGLFGAIDRGGIDEQARRRIRSALGPRTSGLVLFLRELKPTLVTDLLHAHGGTVVEAPLALEDDSELAQELGAIAS